MTPSGSRRARHALTLLALLLSLAGCVSSPGRPDANQADVALGRSEYPKILADYGGAYVDPRLTAWVNGIGQAVARHCGRPDILFTFTVLDSGLVNAFSTPGGYIYVTRGLLALANSEAEVAAVLGHEIGHVVARHQAERYVRSRTLGVGQALIGAVSGSAELERLAESGLSQDLAGFTREQEFEADALGVKMIAMAGYDPGALARFLATLDRDTDLYDRILGDRTAAMRLAYVEDHPLTGERITRALAAVAGVPMPNAARAGRDAYLHAVDGMLYGDSQDQGFARGSVFVHPRAGFLFELPMAFHVQSSPSAVIATRTDGAAIVLTSASPRTAATPLDYLTRLWAPGTENDADPIDINGHPGASATLRVDSDRGEMDVRLVAIGWSPSVVYRLMLIAPHGDGPMPQGDLDRPVTSFRSLAPGEAALYTPLRIRLLTAKAGDRVATLARRMAFGDFREERFRALNGLDGTAELATGQQVKIIE